MINRLGVFGGMFDPVHIGHIHAAQFARQQLNLDQVKLVPCASPNHRSPAMADSRHRLQMLELASTSDAGLHVDALEIERPGTSYSVDTLTQLREAGIAEQLVFILGQDSFSTLPQWHRWRDIFELCHLFVLGRDDTAANSPLIEEEGEQFDWGARLVQAVPDLFAGTAGNVYVARDFSMPVSSSRVRKCLRANGDVSRWLDPKVQRYIEDNQLYR